MKILITGASGRLGPYVIRELMADHELVLFSRSQPDAEFADLPWVQGTSGLVRRLSTGHAGRRTSFSIWARRPGLSTIRDMREQAAEQGIPFDATFKTNMLGTYYLMEAAVAAGVKTVVMAGSNCALGHGFRISGTPFPLQALPIDETHPTYPEDSYSYTKRAGEDLLASYSRAYGIRTYVTRIAGICPPERRQAMADNAKPVEAWSEWMWCWVGSEDVASAHRLLMEAADDLPVHDVFYNNADDTTCLEPSRELVERFNPQYAELAANLSGYQNFFNCDKLKAAVGWQHKTSWRDLR